MEMKGKKIVKLEFFIIIVIISSFFMSCTDELLKPTEGLIVILKADDLGDTTPNWNRFVKKIIDDSICASIGVISKNVHERSIPELQRISNITQVNGFPTVEFWNHGYDHINLKKNDEVTEFYNTNTNYQYTHYQLAQHFFLDSLHIISHSFGAPHNRSDSKTQNVIKDFPEINVWLQYEQIEHYNHGVWKDPKYKLINTGDQHIILSIDYLSLRSFNVIDIEKNYINDSKKNYIVIQIHPWLWGDNAFNKFDNVVQFYKRHKVRFMTPFQYYNYLHNKQNIKDI
jgi:peptidoglycan/xylan/chitin deacetylase (PgdA/CDA1 family)